MKLSVDKNLKEARRFSAEGDNFGARRLYLEILAKFPGNKNATEGLVKCQAALSEDFNHDLHLSQALFHQGKFEEALGPINNLLRHQPDSEVLHNFAGAANAGAGALEEAIRSYDKAIQIKPDYAESYSNRAMALRDLGRPLEALESCENAIRVQPDYINAYLNCGVVLNELGRFDEAVACYDAAIRLDPASAASHYNRSNALRAMMQHERAVAGYDRAIQLKPDYADAYSNRGNALQELKRPNEALESYLKAIQIKPDFAQAYSNLGNVLAELKRLDEAVDSYAKAVHLDPSFAEAAARMLFQQAVMCQWTAKADAFDLSALGIYTNAVSPFGLLALEDSALNHFKRAEKWSNANYVHSQSNRVHVPSHKIRVGYFSADFHDHATMFLMAKLFEIHDRAKFEIHAFSYGPDKQDAMRHRLLNAVDKFHDVRNLSDRQVADLSCEQGIDIAIDLKGYTQDTRSGIFSYRAAPVQMNYLGYPGSMGADFIDYIIADDIVIPKEKRSFYSEKVISLPGSYQVTDNSRTISAAIPDRAEVGLPERGFVFCCFNNNFKISGAEFDIWMRLLGRVQGSVLWLLRDNRWAEANLRNEAVARGIDPARLIFADRVPIPDHLARHRCADLFLDTFTYNAHTTASDALWVGLPVLTKLGDGFAARVAGSLLCAIGAPELVTRNTGAYEELAYALATKPDKLAALASKIIENRWETSLFNTEQFVRDIERAYELSYERYSHGLQPDHLRVTHSIEN